MTADYLGAQTSCLENHLFSRVLRRKRWRPEVGGAGGRIGVHRTNGVWHVGDVLGRGGLQLSICAVLGASTRVESSCSQAAAAAPITRMSSPARHRRAVDSQMRVAITRAHSPGPAYPTRPSTDCAAHLGRCPSGWKCPRASSRETARPFADVARASRGVSPSASRLDLKFPAGIGGRRHPTRERSKIVDGAQGVATTRRHHVARLSD
jgi:hypothetical protein